jgi:hypothetical protein
MFGLFAKKPPYPELSVADRLLIDERKRADESWLKLYLRREKLKFGDEAMRAYAAAVEGEAYERKKLVDDQYDAMMERLKSEAQAHLAAQEKK